MKVAILIAIVSALFVVACSGPPFTDAVEDYVILGDAGPTEDASRDVGPVADAGALTDVAARDAEVADAAPAPDAAPDAAPETLPDSATDADAGFPWQSACNQGCSIDTSGNAALCYGPTPLALLCWQGCGQDQGLTSCTHSGVCSGGECAWCCPAE